MARITLYGRDLRCVALATSILYLCPLSYTLAFLSLCETACSIICSTTSAIRRFSKYLLHFGCIVYHASKLCCLVIALYTTVRRVPIIEEGRAASKSPHYKFGHFISISQPGVTADIIQNSAVANLSPQNSRNKLAVCNN
jgi:hypothetical protein